METPPQYPPELPQDAPREPILTLPGALTAYILLLALIHVVRLLLPYDDARITLGGIGRTTLWELVERGELVRVNIGRRGFITAKSIAAYVDRLAEAATA